MLQHVLMFQLKYTAESEVKINSHISRQVYYILSETEIVCQEPV